MTLSQRAIRALGVDVASASADCAGQPLVAHGFDIPTGLLEELRSLSAATGGKVQPLLRTAVWRLLRDLKAMDAAPTAAPTPPKSPEARGEIARRLGVSS